MGVLLSDCLRVSATHFDVPADQASELADTSKTKVDKRSAGLAKGRGMVVDSFLTREASGYRSNAAVPAYVLNDLLTWVCSIAEWHVIKARCSAKIMCWAPLLGGYPAVAAAVRSATQASRRHPACRLSGLAGTHSINDKIITVKGFC
jgi:hypothetical protein